ncbi:MAG: DUF1028 domain-containing protein [Rhodocyclaceae bacterium]|nr:DUF1028 domain-containing protein [Rhodocyclaceae bacterium]
MTYSIIGRDPQRGELGIAVQSKFPGVGSIVAHASAGAGAITTQAFANPDHGHHGLELLERGASAEETLAILLRNDPQRDQRQLAVMTHQGAAGAHTGAEVQRWDGWSGSAVGGDAVASGNTLAGESVVTAMVDAFESASGEIARRLLQALAAGRDAGGELRGQQSAALLVVKPGGGYGGRDGRHVDVSVYDHPEPIEELARCYELHRLSYFPSNDADLAPIDAAIAAELKAILAAAGFRSLPPGALWDEACITAMARFMGVENYDNRIRDDALIDLEVLADLRRRHDGR